MFIIAKFTQTDLAWVCGISAISCIFFAYVIIPFIGWFNKKIDKLFINKVHECSCEKESYSIQESDTGVWFYHISKDGEILCGAKNVLYKKLPIEQWKFKSSNIPYKYCEKCDEIYNKG